MPQIVYLFYKIFIIVSSILWLAHQPTNILLICMGITVLFIILILGFKFLRGKNSSNEEKH